MKEKWQKIERYLQLGVLLALTAACFVGSFFLDKSGHTWLSNVFLSISCGSITGLIFYSLTNLRNGKQAKARQEYELLYSIYQEAKDLYFDLAYYTSDDRLECVEPDIETYCRTVLNRAYDIFDRPISELDERIFNELGLSVDDDQYPFTDDEETIYRSIENIEDDEGITQANAMLTSLKDKLKILIDALNKPVRSRKMFLESLDKSGI